MKGEGYAFIIFSLFILFQISGGIADGCTDTTKCNECIQSTECFWCNSDSSCVNATITKLNSCDGGWCQSKMCPCAPWPYAPFWFGQIVLMGFYGLLLAGSKFILL